MSAESAGEFMSVRLLKESEHGKQIEGKQMQAALWHDFYPKSNCDLNLSEYPVGGMMCIPAGHRFACNV